MLGDIHDIVDAPYDATNTTDSLEHRRMRVDARKWMMGKLAPKKYGDKQVLEHGGPDGGPITCY